VTQNSYKYGGVADIAGLTVGTSTPGAAGVASSSTSGWRVNSIVLGGIGGSLRVPIIKDKLSFGAKGLYGPGMGRYGNTTLSDVTNDASGNLAPIHNLSGLFTLEATPTPRLMIYLNYGGDYAGRADFATSALTLSDPLPTFCETGVTAATAAANCATDKPGTAASSLKSFDGSQTLATLMAAGGSWGSHFTNTAAITPIGYGSRYASVSPTCSAVANPGLASGSVGFQPAGSGCGNNTRSVQEITGGYWFDIYKGDHGRFRQGIQYGYAVREGWSGSGTAGALSTPLNGAKGIDNMIWTTFRYYLP
jgi:hypothetical protein